MGSGAFHVLRSKAPTKESRKVRAEAGRFISTCEKHPNGRRPDADASAEDAEEEEEEEEEDAADAAEAEAPLAVEEEGSGGSGAGSYILGAALAEPAMFRRSSASAEPSGAAAAAAAAAASPSLVLPMKTRPGAMLAMASDDEDDASPPRSV
jgi:hypothetical protein